jgi:GDP-L-fucose synthase
MAVYSLAGKRVWVAGHKGMVGSAIRRRLAAEACEVITVDRSEVDLKNQAAVASYMDRARPDAVFLAAAKVGGILANDTYPVDFLFDNLMIEANIIEASFRVGVEKLLFLGSSCIYPKFAQQPIVEDALLTGPLEPTNEWYAVAKIAGLKLCAAYRRQYGCDFISAQPTNLYGPEDTYDTTQSHVVPALIAKIHKAKQAEAPFVDIWGTGRPRREFLHADDLADALVFLLEHYSDEMSVNVGWGEDITIAELAALIAETVGYHGSFRYQTDMPDGTLRKVLDVSRLTQLGWRPKIGLREGLADAYAWFCRHQAG